MNVHTITKPITPPLAERIRIVEDYRESGLKMAQFARECGVAVATLGYWNKEYTKKWRHQKESVQRLADGFLTPDGKSKYADPFMFKHPGKGKSVVLDDVQHTRIHEGPDWKKLYEDERAKVEALNKVIAILGYQL